ncbi:MAG: HAD-IB family phosphatase [Bacilli bacterium]|nr:HAD-IB family phosphatase [Bacilli bacterium]
MKINIYDFDETIYNGDSTVDFYLFCLKKKKSIIKYLFPFFIYFILYLLKKSTKETMKEKLYAFLNDFNNIDELIDEFWDKNQKKIKDYYQEKNHQNDIIISASPEFLLNPIAKKLKVKKLIASRVNKKTGKYTGKNCSEEEKVKRLYQYKKNIIVEEVYSDSLKDTPILNLGKRSYLVKKDNIIPFIHQKKHKKILDLFTAFIFAISSSFMTIMFISTKDYNYYLVTKVLFILSFIISFILYMIIIRKQKINIKLIIISILIALYFISNIYLDTQMGLYFINNILSNYFKIYWQHYNIRSFIAILSIPSISTYVYLAIIKIYPYAIEEYKSLKKEEKYFLLFITIIGTILTTIIYTNVNAFYLPKSCNKVLCRFGQYDVIYTTDTGYLNQDNTFYKISSRENDIRQPLFGLFAMPFSLSAKFISTFFAFIPNSYYIIFNIIQIITLGITLLMISRFFEKDKKNKYIYLLLSICTYSFILFSFIQEQYIISLFYLILAIYTYYKYKPKINYLYLCSVGTLLTSGIIVPTITTEKLKNFKKYITNIIKTFLAFVSLVILTGQIIVFFPEKFMFLKGFTGARIIFTQRLKQYLFFIRSIFIGPLGGQEKIINAGYKAYHLYHIDNYSILGIFILILCIISFIKNRKKLIAKISILWIIFSFIILCLIGWGTNENGLILYSLYFFWAFVALISMLINSIKNSTLKRLIFVTIIIIMITANLRSFMDILKFCITYYKN